MKQIETFTPGILSLLPMLYVAWSDSVLSPTEIQVIQEKIKEFEFLTESDKEYITLWMDPAAAPDDKIFKQWVGAITHLSKDLPDENKASLTELGLQIAQASIGYKTEQIWKADETKLALIELEQALGVNDPASKKLLLGNIGEEESINSPFKVEDLQDYLDGAQKTTKNRMRSLLRDPFFSYQTIRNKEEYRMHILKQIKVLSEQGLSAYAFPKEFGGKDDLRKHIAVFEMMAHQDLSLTIKFGVQFGLFGGAISGLGTQKHHEKYLKPMIETDLLGCFAMTETGHGSNVKGLETTAHYDPKKEVFVINTPTPQANKEYIGNAMHSTMAAVFCQLFVEGQNQGVHCVLVPIRDKEMNTLPGVRVEDNGYKMGLNGVDNGKLWFDNVEVPRDNLLDKFGTVTAEGKYKSEIESPDRRFFTMLGALVVGRVSVGMAGISAAKSALTIAIKYGLKRRQFPGKESASEMILMDYPSHQNRLLPRLAKTYAYHFALQKLADDMTQTEHGTTAFREIETRAAGLKAMATWHTTSTIQECREACGGKGYLAENRLTELKADTDIFTTFEGDNTVLLQLVAKGILTDFKRSFNSDGFRAVMRYLGNQVSHIAIENNPVFARNTNLAHLLDKDFHLKAFQYRKEQLLISVSQRMQKYLKKRIAPHDAYLKCQLHLLELSKATVELETIQAFYKAIENAPSDELKVTLEEVCQLYALSTISENKGFYLESDYMAGAKTKAIRRVTAKLSQSIRQKAEFLVDAFGIPEELLGAQIVLYN